MTRYRYDDIAQWWHAKCEACAAASHWIAALIQNMDVLHRHQAASFNMSSKLTFQFSLRRARKAQVR